MPSSIVCSTPWQKLPNVAAHLDAARADVLAITSFPREIWPDLVDNPSERLNREICRRTDVVSILPDRDALIRQVGAVLAEQHDEWAEGRRYLGLDVLARARITRPRHSQRHREGVHDRNHPGALRRTTRKITHQPQHTTPADSTEFARQTAAVPRCPGLDVPRERRMVTSMGLPWRKARRHASRPQGSTPPAPGLQADALGLREVIMQAVGHIAPATGTLASLAFITTLAGVATPVTYIFGGAVIMLVALALMQLARKVDDAGGYFTYVSRTVGPRAGFITAWLYFLYDPLVTGALFSWGGAVIESVMKARLGWGVPWWAFAIAGVALIGFLSWRGIKVSARVLVFAGIAEILIFVALALSGVLNPGPGGISPAPFDPREAPEFNALYLGVVFTIFTFTGFESVAPLAEETRNPRRTLPMAIIVSVSILIAYHAFTSWGIMIGWGVDDIAGFSGSPQPVFDLSERLWGDLWILTLLALLNSLVAVTMATHNAATRVFFALGRVGVLPRGLARLHPTRRTPVNAIAFQSCLSLATALGLGAILGAAENFYFVGILLTLGLIVVYGMGNLGVFRLYRGRFRSEFNPILHALVPLLGTAALVWVGYKSIEDLNITDPQEQLDWTPIVTVGWFLAGLALLAIFRMCGHEAWLFRATEAIVAEENQHDAGNGVGAPRRDEERHRQDHADP